ncbi:N-acetylmuramoyl-L-alanine amidase [Bacillus sp. 196mf]|nr:N-acetylmuramoyl-L-alanine amidase [Bacillus sp. 196mf]
MKFYNVRRDKITFNTIRDEKKGKVDSVIGKHVTSKVNHLRFYAKPSWKYKDVAGTVDAGVGFTIEEKIIVEGSPQYKVRNSKEKR